MTVSETGVIVLKFGGTCLAEASGRDTAVERCRQLVSSGSRVVAVVSAMGRLGDAYSTDTLLGLVSDPPEPEKACLLACGEVIAASVMADALRRSGLRSVAVTGWSAGLLTDGEHCDAGVASVRTEAIRGALQDNDCIVVAGFQGLGTNGGVSLLGRGGSDVTAVALAAALGADRLILYKTIDSVYTADPTRVPDAVKVETISAEDLRQMAWQGAEVVHPRASEIAVEAGIRIEIRNHGSGRGVTTVEPYVLRSGRYITGVASGAPVAQFTVRKGSGGNLPMQDRQAVSAVLEGAGLSGSFVEYCSKVSIVGAGMHGMKGVMSRFTGALDRAGIDMLQTVDSHATISALVPLAFRDMALRALHREFIEE